MKVLILGGTRFLGKKIAQLIIDDMDFDLTVISRKADVLNGKYQALKIDRHCGLVQIKGLHFDLVIDFIAYNKESVQDVIDNIKFERYTVISTCWINKLNSKYKMNEFIKNVNVDELSSLPKITQEYLLNKREIENYLYNNLDCGLYNIIRLPIMFGEGDHTNRLEFYVSRFKDQNNLILVDGGQNFCQVEYVNNISKIFLEYLKNHEYINEPILEVLPTESQKVSDFLLYIKKAINSRSKFKNLNSNYLQKKLPEYLNIEPLWRENKFERTSSNLFKLFVDVELVTLKDWLFNCSKILAENQYEISSVRKKEITLIKKN